MNAFSASLPSKAFESPLGEGTSQYFPENIFSADFETGNSNMFVSGKDKSDVDEKHQPEPQQEEEEVIDGPITGSIFPLLLFSGLYFAMCIRRKISPENR